MYSSFYGFQSEPFSLTPDSRFLYPSKRHEEALAALVYGVQHRKGFIAVTGEIGSGKTTLCRAFMAYLERVGTQIALVLNPDLNDIELLQSICAEFGLPDDSTSKRVLLRRLNEFLLQTALAGRNSVLILDEAQNLPPRTLEQVRMISNLETETEKLIQIVLVGQPQLDELLHRPELEQLNQRITVRYHLNPLSPEEVGRYVTYRLKVARPESPLQFTDQAINLLARHSGGIPRRINVICDRALLLGYVEETWIIERKHIETAIAEVAGSRPGKAVAEATARAAGVAGDGEGGEFGVGGGVGAVTESELAAGVVPEALARSRGRSRRIWLLAASLLVVAAVYAGVVVAPRLARSLAASMDRPALKVPTGGEATVPRQDATLAQANTAEPVPAPRPEESQNLSAVRGAQPAGAAAQPSPSAASPTPLATAGSNSPTTATLPSEEANATTMPAPPSAVASASTTTTELAVPRLPVVSAPQPPVSPEPPDLPAGSADASATTPTAESAALRVKRWSVDDSGIVRVDRAGRSRVAAVLTWLQLEGKPVDLAALNELPPEQVRGLELATGRPPLWLRQAPLPAEVDRLRTWSRPCLVRMAGSTPEGATWAVLESFGAEGVRLLDPLHGIRALSFVDFQGWMKEAVGLYLDPDDVSTIQPGDGGPAVGRLVELLRLRGLLVMEDGSDTSPVFDMPLVGAVAAFQKQRGVEATGKLDGATAWLLLSLPR